MIYLNWPNRITLLRIILIPVFVMLMQYSRKAPIEQAEIFRIYAIVVFLICAISDALDGFFARILNQETKLGVILDPLADKFLLTSAIIILTFHNPVLVAKLPIWFSCLVIGRDFLIILGSIVVYMIIGDINIIPSKIGKWTTAFQMTTVIWILLKLPNPFIVIIITTVTTIYSGIQYVLFGSAQIYDYENKVIK